MNEMTIMASSERKPTGWGLLWQVAGDRSLPEEIAAAAARYEEKFNLPVGLILIHPAQDDGTRRWNGAEVRLGQRLHGHLFLCQAQEQEAVESCA